jgi:RimJ/RimL family protein N-acetyltransferase
MEPPDPTLSDGVVWLRPADERDTDAIERGITDPEIVRWFGQPTMSARDVLELNRDHWLDGSGPTFAICAADDRCVGHVWVNFTDDPLGAVGYWLLPEVRGQGFATRAVRLICDWAFRDLVVPGLRLLTDPDNLASQRVAERTGFRRTGLLPSKAEKDGRGVDHMVFSLLPDPRPEDSAVNTPRES